jgi:hypothetical protein
MKGFDRYQAKIANPPSGNQGSAHMSKHHRAFASLASRRPSGTGWQVFFAAVGRRVLPPVLLLVALGLSACDSGEDAADPAAANDASQSGSTQTREPPGEDATREADGVITATFNGTERTWYITSAERGGRFLSQSDWTPLFAEQNSVTLFGHVSPTWPFPSAEGIIVAFTLQGTGDAPAVSGAEITYLSGGIMNNHSSSHDGTATITVESAGLEGNMLEISGAFSGTLPFKSFDGSVPSGPEETISVESGTFHGVVRQLEDE